MAGIVLRVLVLALAVTAVTSLADDQTKGLKAGLCDTLSGSAADVATRVGDAFVREAAGFINRNGGFTYGAAVVADGLHEATSVVDAATGRAWTAALDTLLETYKGKPNGTTTVPCTLILPNVPKNRYRACGYALLNGPTMPFTNWEFTAVGDALGLFPIAYLSSYQRTGNKEDLAIAQNTILNYVEKYPHRLADGSFSRLFGCCGPAIGENHAPYLWSDDQNMGLTLMVRGASTFEDGATRQRLLDLAVRVQLAYSSYFTDKADGLGFHGAYFNGSLRHSCCKWSRANGWGMMSRVEVLRALAHNASRTGATLAQAHPNASALLADFRAHVDAMVKHQDPTTGRWHQLINETDTFLETSTTAMTVFALAEGLINGWLVGQTYETAALRGWQGLVSQVAANGTVSGVCEGTGILHTKAEYAARGTNWESSSPGGVGAVLRAARAIHDLNTSLLH